MKHQEAESILFCAEQFADAGGPFHGPAWSAHDVLLALRSYGKKLDVVSSSPDRHGYTRNSDRCNHLTWHHLQSRAALRGLRPTLQCWRQERIVRRMRPNLLLVNEFASHRLLESWRDWKNMPRAMIMRAAPDQFSGKWDGRADSLPRIMEELKHYSHLIHVSRHVAASWASHYSEPITSVIPNCAPEDRLDLIMNQPRDVVQKRLGLSPDSFHVVCVGSIQFRKGQDILLRAWTDFTRLHPRAELHLVGPVIKEWGGQEIMDGIDSQSHGHRIHWAGPTPDAGAYIYAADALVLPSRSEALPRVLLEAMYLGTPIIASRVDGIPELVPSSAHGFLFPVPDADQLLDALIHFKDNPEKRHDMARRAKAHYNQCFSRSHQIALFHAFLDDILKPGRSSS